MEKMFKHLHRKEDSDFIQQSVSLFVWMHIFWNLCSQKGSPLLLHSLRYFTCVNLWTWLGNTLRWKVVAKVFLKSKEVIKIGLKMYCGRRKGMRCHVHGLKARRRNKFKIAVFTALKTRKQNWKKSLPCLSPVFTTPAGQHSASPFAMQSVVSKHN